MCNMRTAIRSRTPEKSFSSAFLHQKPNENRNTRNKSQNSFAKPDVYKEDVTKIRVPLPKSNSSVKLQTREKVSILDRLKFPEEPTSTSPEEISEPLKKAETSNLGNEKVSNVN